MFNTQAFLMQLVNILLIVFGIIAPIWIIIKIISIDNSLKEIKRLLEK